MGNYTKSGKIPVGGRKKKRSVAGTRALQLYRNSIRTREVVNTVPLNHELLSATDSDHESLKTTTINDIENEELSELCVETEIKEINATEIKGRRVVDIMYLFKALKSLKHDGFSCSFFDMDIINEKRVGFESIFTIKCLVCNLVTYIHTECPELKESYMNINAAATNAIVTTGGGYRQLTAFCSALDIPSISSATYYKYQNKLFVAINDVAREEMKLAGEEEARLAKERGDVDANGNPVITVVADGAWSKRSYRTNYNALSGVACIVGLATKKVLYIGVKNRYCMICDSNIFREKKDHFCYKNWNKAATGMEAAAIVEGFCSSMELHGLVYGRLVGDGDSSVYRKINEILPYGTQTIVQKVECTNHILRNYLSKLRDLKSKVGTSVEDRNYIINNIMRFRNAVTSAIKYRNSQTMLTVEEKTNLLEKDILNSPYHILGSHSNCDKYFCKRADNNEINLVPRFEENGLIEDILKCIKRVADNSCSLLYECNNNIAEQYNSYVAQFVSGKRINYSLRGSYAARCHAAVTAYNTDGQLVRKVNEAYTGNSAGYYTTKYCQREEQRMKRRRETGKKRMQRKKALQFTGPDRNYGPDAADDIPDMLQEQFQTECTLFLQELRDTDSKELEEKTRSQNKSMLWRKERLKRLTSSEFGRICKLRNTTSRRNVVNILLYGTFFGNKATKYGTDNEGKAIKNFEEITNIRVEQCGMFIYKDRPYLSASPDGITDNNCLVEVKCPFSAKDMTVKEGVENKKISFLVIDGNGEFKLKENHNYFYQIQGQLEIVDKELCYFIISTQKDTCILKISRNREFWNNIVEKLEIFYMKYLLPELVDPRKRRGLELRN